MPDREPIAGAETAGAPPEGQAASRRRRSWRLLHGIVILGQVAAVLLLLLAGAAGILYWRLTQGPISLSFLTPYVEEALVSRDGRFSVRIGETVALLDEEDRTIGLLARDILLVDDKGQSAAALPEISLGLSLAAAARGIIAPTRLTVLEPTLRLQRDENGSFRLFATPSGDSSEFDMGAFLDELSRPPDPSRASGSLRQVALRQGTVQVDDRRLGRTWSAANPNLRARRGDKGLNGSLSASVEIGDMTTPLAGLFQFEMETRRLVAVLSVDNIRPERLAGLARSLEPLRTVDAAIGGQARLTIDIAAARVEASRLDLTLSAGRIVHDALPGGGAEVAGGRLVADYDPSSARLAIDQFRIDLGGPAIEVKGTIDNLRLDPGLGDSTLPLVVAAELVARNVAAAELDRLWPTRLAASTREWVTENISEGSVEETRVSARARIRPDDLSQSVLDALSGTMQFKKLAVHFLRPLPPVRGIDGSARFDRARMQFAPTGGQLAGVSVKGGNILIYDLDRPDERIAIDLPLEGPMRDVLTVLDSPPLGYAKEIGIDPALVTGTARAQVIFRFPLKKDLKFDDTEVSVKGELAQIGVRKLVFDRDATDGVFELALDKKGLKIQGGAKLANVPAAASLDYTFKPAKDAPNARYTVWSVVDKAGRQRLGLDILPDMISGPVAVDATAVERAGKRQVTLSLGLKDAGIVEDLIGYEKQPGRPASARMALDFANDQLAGVRDLVVSGEQLDIRADMSLGGRERDIQRIEFKRLRAGGTDATGIVTRRPEGGWRIEAQGRSWDGSKLLGREKMPAATPPQESVPFALDARVDRVLLGPGREARQVAAQVVNGGKHWDMARVEARVGEQGTLTLRYGLAGGTRDFNLSSTDMGAVFRLADISENIVGGTLTVSGRAEDAGPQRVLRGTIDGKDYKLINAPGFAKLLSFASLPTVSSLLAGEGIPFTALVGGFALTEDRLTLDKARAYGGAIGINASGTINLNADTVELQGTLVPAYTLNSLLGKIPVLGPLILGGEGQGIFAVNFRATGPAGNPQITINPLSALAPGALRNLFLFNAPSGGGSPPALGQADAPRQDP